MKLALLILLLHSDPLPDAALGRGELLADTVGMILEQPGSGIHAAVASSGTASCLAVTASSPLYQLRSGRLWASFLSDRRYSCFN